jgi:hypothetical protein
MMLNQLQKYHLASNEIREELQIWKHGKYMIVDDFRMLYHLSQIAKVNHDNP